MACLGEPCPSAVQLTEAQSDPTFLWMAARKTKLTDALTEAAHSRRCFARPMALLLYFLTASPSLFCLFTLLAHRLSPSDSIKETGVPTLIRWFFRVTSRHLLGLPAFRIKSSSLPQNLVSERAWTR